MQFWQCFVMFFWPHFALKIASVMLTDKLSKNYFFELTECEVPDKMTFFRKKARNEGI